MTLMGTVLVYIALRLMGLPAEHGKLVKARVCFTQMGGMIYLPCWAKYWLAMLGLYEWEGTDPYPAEMWYVENVILMLILLPLEHRLTFAKAAAKLVSH